MKAIFEIPDIWYDIAEDTPETLNSRSINKNSKVVGTIGELAVAELLACYDVPYSFVDGFDYDFLVGNCRIDVKTNAPKYVPHADSRVLLTDYQRHQKCDHYIFTVVNILDNTCTVMGHCSKEWFWSTDLAIERKRGEKITNTAVKEDARLVKYKHLSDIEEAKKWKALALS